MSESQISQDFYGRGLNLLLESMKVIKRGLVYGASSVSIKADKTLVTDQDVSSEGLMRTACATFFPGIPFIGEEGGYSEGKGSLCFLCDPLDNTRKFRDGEPGSAVLLALCDKRKGEVIACHAGDPSGDRIWSAADGKPPICLHTDGTFVRVARVREEVLGDNSSLRLDVSHGFNVFNDAQICHLFGKLVGLGRSLFIGSNVLNQAIVANGGAESAVATAKGGPWDFAAACRLVPDAGGTVYAYRAIGSVVGQKTLERLDYLDPFVADVLVMGNSQSTADIVAKIVESL